MTMNHHLPDAELQQLVDQWIAYDTDMETRNTVCMWKEKQQWTALDKAMRPRIAFGTAGLRAEMGPGFARMNKLTVLQASQGLAAYVKSFNQSNPVAVIGYDHRKNSKDYAQIAVHAFAKKGFKVFLFPDIVPTPLLAFSVLHLKADVGVMVTASHNPKTDNGYKVYWSNGAQIISPHDTNILASIQENLTPWPELQDPDVQTFVPDTFGSYLQSLTSITVKAPRKNSHPLAVYTAMHGVGYSTVVKAVEICGLPPLIPVSSQTEPDPEFPTAPKPNPEESGAFDEAIKAADTVNVDIIFSNDPDADRLAIAEKQRNGEWRIFSGDEIGILLASYLVEEGHFSKHSHLALLNTIVSSPLLGIMVSNWKKTFPDKQFEYLQCLTGFKNLTKEAYSLIDKGFTVAFAYEEALGYMCGTNVMDKDGISALIIAYECLVNDYPLTLSQRLNNVYEKHGYISVLNDYYLASDMNQQIPAAFNLLSKLVNVGLVIPVSSEDIVIDSVIDKSASKIFIISIKKPYSITICFRASGTEPKLKFYTQLGPVDYTPEKKCHWDQKLRQVVFAVIENILKPSKLGLVPSEKLERLIE